MSTIHETEIRVRYQDADGMGIVHHSKYLVFFEEARVAMTRDAGYPYRQMEEDGLFFAVAKITCQYIAPARFEDLLRVKTTIKMLGLAKIEHLYELYRGEELLAKGEAKLAAVDRDGKPRMIPDFFIKRYLNPSIE